MSDKCFINKVIVIPLKLQKYKKLKVAAYCRVSTLSPTQRRSLDCQIKFYTKMITENPDWIMPVYFMM